MIQQCSMVNKKRLLTIGISGSKLFSIYVFVFPWESFVPERCFEYVFFSYTVCVTSVAVSNQGIPVICRWNTGGQKRRQQFTVTVP